MDRVADGQVTEQLSVEDVTRPAPMEPIADRLRAWVGWFGFTRIVVSGISMVIVCAGAFWLVRSPPPSAEAVLPQASVAGPPSSTLPPPPPTASQVAADGSGPSVLGTEDVTVHVAGAVRQPGVYLLAAGSRVGDAVEAAGGAGSDADVDALNLAAIVADGVRVYVPQVGELPPSGPFVSGGVQVAPEPAGPVDVNRADVAELDALPGVGPATAAAIVAERERNGPFLTVEDLERVPGIGPSKLAGLRDLVIA